MRPLAVLLLAGCASAPGVVAVRGDLSGSGVAVAPDRVVTAAHLLGAYEPEVLRRINAGRALRSSGQVLSVSGDVAVLRVARGISAGTVEIGPPLQPGDEATIWDGTVWPPAVIPTTAIESGTVRAVGRLDRVRPGLSGAPVLDRKGRLAGIVSAVLTGAAGGPLILISRVEVVP